jgi:hypothetical protein
VSTVVGVVPDTRYRDLREARPSAYIPLRQSFFPFVPWTLAIRTTGPPADAVPAIRRVIGEAAPGVALVSAAPFEDFLDGPLAQPRLNALLLAVFAGAAVTLAAVGLFGAMATLVRQRTRELGVRMALGASARRLRRMVMRRGLVITATGSALGLCASLLANRLLAALLYEVTPTDPATFASEYFNIGHSTARGVEISGDVAASAVLRVRAGYTVLASEIVESTADPLFGDAVYAPGQPLLRRPRHSGFVGLAATWSRVTASLDGVSVGEFADSDFSSLSPEILVNPGWTTWNARAGLAVTRQFTATLAIDNIGDHQYMEPLGYRALGRAVRVGLRAGF